MAREETDYIVIHCAATKPSMDIGVKDIDKWHRQRGWRKVGYHYVIKRDGEVEIGRELDEVGAHAKGFNSNSVGICLVGGLSEDGKPENNYTDEQWIALRETVNQLKLPYPEAEVLGHRDLPDVNKECPCFDVREWWTAEQAIS